MKHLLITLLNAFALTVSAATANRPNILFILTDDQNPDTLACFGGKVLTPTLDQLCREGVKFTRAYTSSSVCTPSRYTCMTGQYPPAMQQEINRKTLGRPAYHMDMSANLQQLALNEHPGYWDADQLYDLQADPGERLNLAKDPKHAQTVAELKSRLKEWLAGFQRPFGEFAP